jgi:hypothetical protein
VKAKVKASHRVVETRVPYYWGTLKVTRRKARDW